MKRDSKGHVKQKHISNEPIADLFIVIAKADVSANLFLVRSSRDASPVSAPVLQGNCHFIFANIRH